METLSDALAPRLVIRDLVLPRSRSAFFDRLLPL